MDLKLSDDGLRFFLPPDCSIGNASELKEALVSQTKGNRKARPDLSLVRSLDLSFLQLFLSYLKNGNKGKARLTWTGGLHPDAEAAIRLSGYMEHLEPYRSDGDDDDD